MICFLYEIVKTLKQSQIPGWKLVYKINKVLVNVFYPLTQIGKKSMGTDNEGKMIVSMTTYPGRVDQVWKTIVTLMNQTMAPKRIILWLAEEQFPTKELPVSLKRLQKRGLEIKFCDDLKSHKKYYEAFLQFPGEVIVTADDDIFYPEDHLEKLWKMHLEFPDSVICHWSHKIAVDDKGTFIPYNAWKDNSREQPAFSTLAVGCNGILYPPTDWSEILFDKTYIEGIALKTDDLWLKVMEILSDVKTVNCNDKILIYFNILSTRKSGLWTDNTGEEKNNDLVWNNLMEEFPVVRKRLVEEIESERVR